MLNIQTDSRKIKKGDTFVAVKCEVNDGHKYIDVAIKAGASKIVAECGSYSVETLIVKDTRKYLVDYLDLNYKKYLDEMALIGYTGTNGKTTSAYLMYQTLNKLGVNTAYIGTIGFFKNEKIKSLPNTSVDVCDCYDLLMDAYESGFKTVVMEISSQALANNRVGKLDFDYVYFTNLTRDHLDYHKTMENYAKAKALLFDKVRTDGIAFVNFDSEYKDYFIKKENNTKLFGFNGGHYKVDFLNMNGNGSVFEYNSTKIKTKLRGKYNIYNLMTVIVLLEELGYTKKIIKSTVRNIKTPPGRMDIIEYKRNNIIVDYAHTPDGFSNFISTVRDFTKGCIYIVFGCTGDRDRLKRPIMAKIVDDYAKYFIITNDDPHNEDEDRIVEDILRDNDFKNKYEVCLDRKEAIIKGINLLKKNDALLILGKGHEEVMIIKDKRLPFNDKKVVIEYIGG